MSNTRNVNISDEAIDRAIEIIEKAKTRAFGPNMDGVAEQMKKNADEIVKSIQGMKRPAGKTEWSLLPWKPLEEIVGVFTHGKNKYARDNWKDNVSENPDYYVDAALRHFVGWMLGRNGGTDAESGKNHLAHAASCIIILLWLEMGGDNG